MSEDEDPYFKLRPAGPTPADEICACPGDVDLVLMGTHSANPLWCFVCNREVPPERVGFSSALAEEIRNWRAFYVAFDTLWLDSQELEEWAYAHLADANSVVNVRGMQVAATLNESRRTYLAWFEGDPDDEPLADCPRCGAALTVKEDWWVCEGCSIAVSRQG